MSESGSAKLRHLGSHMETQRHWISRPETQSTCWSWPWLPYSGNLFFLLKLMVFGNIFQQSEFFFNFLKIFRPSYNFRHNYNFQPQLKSGGQKVWFFFIHNYNFWRGWLKFLLRYFSGIINWSESWSKTHFLTNFGWSETDIFLTVFAEYNISNPLISVCVVSFFCEI